MDYYNYEHFGYHQSQQINHHKKNKLDSFRKRESTDSAYDSILLTSSHHSPTSSFSYSISNSNSQSDYFSSSDTNSNHSSLFSHPTTPVKSFIINSNNSSTTPDFKQQYIADINSFYFASIRQSTGCASIGSTSVSSSSQSACSSYTSPFKSCTNSPAKYDSFIQKRDNITTKLLRSPAFKIDSPSPVTRHHPYESPAQKPYIKSFSSRFQNLNLKPPEPVVVHTTPTQEEFMQRLIQNHLLPQDPENLIGSHMGLDHLDILTELKKRSMNEIVEKIFSHLSVSDCVRVGCVSREWRSLIKQDKKRNPERVKLIKTKRYFFETFKENCAGQQIDMNKLEQKLLKSNLNFNQMTMCSPQKSHSLANQRRSLYKLNCEQQSTECINNVINEINDISNDLMNTSHFRQLDVNCMENLYSNLNSKTISQMKAEKKSPVKLLRERMSPVKRLIKHDRSPIKTDAICSKKSKKNLKRL